jgi:hypothetical protein
MSETIQGFKIRDDKIVVSVTSNGCTHAASFRLDVADGIACYMLTIVRTVTDDCKAMPHVVEVEFEVPKKLKGKSFTVQNRFASAPEL